MTFPETRLSYQGHLEPERKDASADVEHIDVTDQLSEDELQALFDAMQDDDYDVVAELTLAAEGRYEAAEAVAQAKVGGQNVSPKDQENTQRLREYWAHGKGAAKIRWGTKGDFKRCVRLVSKFMRPDQAKGFCNLRHKEALGYYPSTHAAMDRRAHGKKTFRDVIGAPSIEEKAGGMKFKNGDMVKAKGSPDGVSPMGVVTSVNEADQTVTVKHSKAGGGKGTVSKTYKPGQLTMVRSSNDSGPDKGKPKPPWLQKKADAVLEGSLEDLSATLAERFQADEAYDSVEIVGTYPDRIVAIVREAGVEDRTVEVAYTYDADTDVVTFGEEVETEVPEEALDVNEITDSGEPQLSDDESDEDDDGTDDDVDDDETKGLYVTLPGTWESTQDAIRAAVHESFDDDGRDQPDGERDYSAIQYAMIAGTFDDHVIVRLEGPGLESADGGHYISVPWAKQPDGTIELGDPVDVEADVDFRPVGTPDADADGDEGTNPGGAPAGPAETPEDGTAGGVKVVFEGIEGAEPTREDRLLALRAATRG